MPSTLKVTFFILLIYIFAHSIFFSADVLKMSYGRDGSEEHVKGRVLKGLAEQVWRTQTNERLKGRWHTKGRKCSLKKILRRGSQTGRDAEVCKQKTCSVW